MKGILVLPLLLIVYLSGCINNTIVQDKISGNTNEVMMRNCKQEGYYQNLTGNEIYYYNYNTGLQSWIVEMPELCVKLNVKERQYGGSNDTVRDMHRQSGIVREGNRVVQKPLSEDIKNQLIQQYPNEELYLEDIMLTQIQFFSIVSGDTITGSIQKIWGNYLPNEECISTINSSIRDVFVETDNIIQYDGIIQNPTQNSPINGCPSIFAYRGENRLIIPLDYPQGTFDFFAPKIEFTDR